MAKIQNIFGYKYTVIPYKTIALSSARLTHKVGDEIHQDVALLVETQLHFARAMVGCDRAYYD